MWLSRVVAVARSSAVAVTLLIVANLIPLAGVLFLGWDVATILILYWLENGVVGIFNIPRILFAAPPPVATGGPVGIAANAGLVAFFALHYGIFWIAHGAFVVALTGGLMGRGFPPNPLGTVAAEPTLLLAALALVLGHGADLILNYFGRGEYRTATARGQMFEPYPRMVVLHLTILLGGIAVAGVGQPYVLVALLVVGKTVLDLALFLRRRRQTATAGQAQTAAR